MKFLHYLLLSVVFFSGCLEAAEEEASDEKADEIRADQGEKDKKEKEKPKQAEEADTAAVLGRWAFGMKVARIWGKSHFEKTVTSGGAGLEAGYFLSPPDAGRRYSLRGTYLPISMSMRYEDRDYRGMMGGALFAFGLDQRIRGKHRFLSQLGAGGFIAQFRTVDRVEPGKRKTAFYPALNAAVGYAYEYSQATSFGPELLAAFGKFRYVGFGAQIQLRF